MLAAAREKYRNKEEIIWDGCRLSFFPDMTKETAEKRRKFKDVRSQLHDLDVHFILAYPAELRFTSLRITRRQWTFLTMVGRRSGDDHQMLLDLRLSL